MSGLSPVLVLVAFLGAGCRPFSVGPAVVDTGSAVVATRGERQITYTRAGAFHGDFMVFGGQPVNGIWSDEVNAFLAGLPVAEARRIHARYPDFHLCASSGAEAAKSAVLSLNLLSLDSTTRDRIDGAIREHERRLGRGGERLCVTLRGHTLLRRSYKVSGIETTVVDVTPFTHVLIETFDTYDCKPVLEARQ
jgi:hypothetical protein